MAQLVRQNVREEGIETQVSLRGLGQHARGDGFQNGVELGLLHVLQHHALAAFFLDHALVVGQVIGGGADAMRAIARRPDLIHYRMGASAPSLGLR